MSDPDASRGNILIIEDEEHLAHGIRFNLEAEGYRVTVVGDAQAALAQIEPAPGRFALIVLDIMLPGMSGYEFCAKFRQIEPDTPVLVLSARTLREDHIRAFDVGANQYMTKPFDLDEFLSRVNNLLRFKPRRLEPTAEQFEFGNAVVLFDAFEVRIGQHAHRLTPLEMKLLRYFIDNAGRIVSRTELLEKVWELPGDVNTRAPDQFLRRLRKLFEIDPARPRHFITIRDVGYRFIPEPGGDAAGG